MGAIIWNKPVDLDRIKLRKFEGERTYYFASRENVWMEISEQLFWRVTRYQMRNSHKADDNLYILGTTNVEFNKHAADRNVFGKN
jgi:hypothetical protein